MVDGEKELIRKELKRRLKGIVEELEHTDRRDPFRQDLYEQRRQLTATLKSLDAEIAWETECEVLSRSMPEDYGGW